MSTKFGFFSTSWIIFSIIVFLTIGTRCTFSKSDLTFEDHQLPHRLTKRQNNKDTTCEIPAETADKVYAVTESKGNRIENPQQGLRVSNGAYVEVRCVKGYAFDDGRNSSKSICSSEGKWLPEIKSCLRICDPLRPSNVEITCRFNKRDVNCNKKLLSGTIVHARCKELFHPSSLYDLAYTSIQCQDDGRWDYPLFKCIPDCGKPAPPSLIGDVTTVRWPWHVAIFSLKAAEPLICGGTLITTNVVLTAAHCFYDYRNKISKKDPADYEIAVAKITRNRTRIDNPAQKTLQISEIIFYDRPYNPATNGYASDIALVILKECVTISPTVLPACYRGNARSEFNPGAGAMGSLAGWGVDETGIPGQILRTVQVPYVNYTECVKVTSVTLDKFCAGSGPQKGDNGGGLMFKDPHRNLYFIRGILSTSTTYTEKVITQYTDVTYYEEWIDRILKEKKVTEYCTSPGENGQ